MGLKVGMYVRTDRGKIGKFRKEVGDYYELEYPKNVCDLVFKNRCLKDSFDITDLIEVGDYVNGKRVDEVILIEDEHYIKTRVSNTNNCDYLPSHLIKTIVTHEQFESISYKVD